MYFGGEARLCWDLCVNSTRCVGDRDYAPKMFVAMTLPMA